MRWCEDYVDPFPRRCEHGVPDGINCGDCADEAKEYNKSEVRRMLALRKQLDPGAPDAIVFREQYMGDFEHSHTAKYPQKVLADLLDAKEITLEQFERLRREPRTN